MGKLFDYCMTGDWEKTQRIALFKKIGKRIEDMNKEELKEALKKLENK